MNAPAGRYERFESFREYEERLDALIPRALGVIRVFERRLSPAYGSTRRCQLLRAFLRGDPARRLLVVVHETGALASEHPRLLALAADYGERLQIRRTTGPARRAYDPYVVVDSSHYLHRFHHDGMRAAQAWDDVAGAVTLIERHDELWTLSTSVRTGPPAGL